MIPVVLSGGSGTRLWPVSRSKFPKQFCDFYDKSFIEETLERLKPLNDPRVLTVQSLKSLTEQVIKDAGLDAENLILEPYGKNTAPAIALLCHLLHRKRCGDEVVGVFPADHIILKKDDFYEAVNFGEQCALEGKIVTLGIKPSRASTSFGYIEIQETPCRTDSNLQAHSVKQFCEKPNVDRAEEFLKSGHHYWNAGIFLFKVNIMIEHFNQYLPDLWSRISGLSDDLSNLNHVYANLESISIDYGIMEKLKDQVCIPCDIGWSDVGSWEEIARVGDEIRDLNRTTTASVFCVNSSRNYTYLSDHKVVGYIGVNDLIVVDTPDGLLISKKGQSENVKEIVHKMLALGFKEAQEHFFEKRPWGSYDILRVEKGYKLKKITVLPGRRLSYQSHDYRAEHWVVVTGEGVVTLDGKGIQVKRDSYVYVPLNSKHRIENTSTTDILQFIEVQIGTSFSENDFKRYEDDYCRDLK